MPLLRSAALQVPSIRRLVEHRDRLLAELEAERAAHRALEQDTAGLRQARDQNRLFVTESAYFPAARPIEIAAGGRQIAALFRRAEPAIAATIAGIARHAENLARIPRQQDGPLRPHWENDWFPPFDGAALYGPIAETRPCRRGSSPSTRIRIPPWRGCATRRSSAGWRTCRPISGPASPPTTSCSSTTATAASPAPTSRCSSPK